MTFSGNKEPDLAAIVDRLAKLEVEVVAARKAAEFAARLSEPFGVYLGDDTVLTSMANGTRFMVPASDAVMAPKMIGNRVWEPRITKRLTDIVRLGKDFVDIGANIGYFAVNVATLLHNSGARVYAFEPNPKIFALLQRNDQINWSIAPIQLHQMALGAEPGTLRLSVPNKQASNASLLDRPMRPDVELETYEVEVRRLDDLDIEPARVGLMKIDVEGAEALVLRGGQRFIDANPDIDIIMEWDRGAQKHDPGSTDWLVAFFNSRSYNGFSFEHGMAPIPAAELGRLDYCNVFFTRREGWSPK
jgi:FkbM family methyltransferase